MSDLALWQLALIAVIFIWSGFVRSGLGFGGSVLSLPFILMIDNRPLVYLPICGIQLLFFATLTVWQNNRKRSSMAQQRHWTVDWKFLRYALPIMIIPKLLGVFGVIMLPPSTMSLIIFVIVAIYGMSYLLNKPFRSRNKAFDALFLILGGYFSGTSLVGAPMVMAVMINRVDRHKIRDTILTLWWILVSIKIGAFVWADVDLQLIHQLWLLPCAAIGHYFGLKFHDHILKAETPLFFRTMGAVLVATSIVGLIQSAASS